MNILDSKVGEKLNTKFIFSTIKNFLDDAKNSPFINDFIQLKIKIKITLKCELLLLFQIGSPIKNRVKKKAKMLNICVLLNGEFFKCPYPIYSPSFSSW